jgi:DNA-binding transcriptional MocR family regulator
MAGMRIPLDRQSKKPLYRQIEGFLREQILLGALLPDMRLPATRELAHSLGVNRITVTTAYAELESQGLIGGRAGSGSYVLPHTASIPSILRDDRLGRLPAWQRALGSQEWLTDSFQLDFKKCPFCFAAGAGDERMFPVERALEAFITVGRYHAHLRRICRAYGRRRDRMGRALAACGLEGMSWRIPDGGLFMWLGLPPMETPVLIEQAAQGGIGLLPPSRFFPDGRDRPFLRLNFASQSEECIDQGISRLAMVLGKRLVESRHVQ